MKDNAIDARDERMLELLATGASNRDVAEQLGYQEGTIRVYLSNLYKKIGVSNKTEAVVWLLSKRDTAQAAAAAAAEPSYAEQSSGDLVGDMALQDNLFIALGVMSAFIGPYSYVWEVGRRMKGEDIDDQLRFRRQRSRVLWRALLSGDWSYGKRNFDADGAAGLIVDSPSDAVMLASLLIAGGYSSAADRLTGQLTQKRKAGTSATPREVTMLRALRGALEGHEDGLAQLHDLAAEKSASQVLRQLASVLVFHTHATRRDYDRARVAANAVWAEAEAARQQLQAMGERPLGVARAPASAPKAPKRAMPKEKVTAR
ncbi:MAG TPA: helix-turn-helix transcriptional regulator [Usitatibacter sp.]|nr:helix-turn-helix transcriptional regulator [Usitatibacter sp.]